MCNVVIVCRMVMSEVIPSYKFSGYSGENSSCHVLFCRHHSYLYEVDLGPGPARRAWHGISPKACVLVTHSMPSMTILKVVMVRRGAGESKL